ncbi:hypothetical protein EGI16_08995 [Chryseobacterium sp. G0240]|nr:hypothetical protein EGI16_08995 [Chryseobacterium sp. G0240]
MIKINNHRRVKILFWSLILLIVTCISAFFLYPEKHIIYISDIIVCILIYSILQLNYVEYEYDNNYIVIRKSKCFNINKNVVAVQSNYLVDYSIAPTNNRKDILLKFKILKFGSQKKDLNIKVSLNMLTKMQKDEICRSLNRILKFNKTE